MNFGSAVWKVLHINSEKTNDTNDSSIVIELAYNTTKYLFMGDASTDVEKSRTWNDIDVLKVAHHGSNSSTSQDFLKQVKPEIAVISVGENDYGHPTDTVLKNLGNVELYRTDKNGTIWITSDGKKINIIELDYNLDGNGRKISCLPEKVLQNTFFFNVLQYDTNHLLEAVICLNAY